MSLFANLIGGIAENIVKGWVQKAVQGFVAKGYITAAQAPILVEGVMLELQVGLDEYQASQKASPPA